MVLIKWNDYIESTLKNYLNIDILLDSVSYKHGNVVHLVD